MPRITVEKRGRSIEFILHQLSPRNVVKAVSPGASKVIQKLVKKQFVKQADPYGKRWKRKKKRDSGPVLTGKTRQLRRNIDPVVTRTGFGARAATDYASFHQDGTKKKGGGVRMPQRKIFPDFASMPRSWKIALRPVVTKAITDIIK